MINNFPIYCIRGEKVIVDTDLAKIYGVAVKRLNEQVKRNAKRFPVDFSFIIDKQEFMDMRSQIATASSRNIRHKPRVFTEHGAIAAAMILNSEKAIAMSTYVIAMSTYVVRAFVKLRSESLLHTEIKRALTGIDKKLLEHDDQIARIAQCLLPLLDDIDKNKKKRIGFL